MCDEESGLIENVCITYGLLSVGQISCSVTYKCNILFNISLRLLFS